MSDDTATVQQDQTQAGYDAHEGAEAPPEAPPHDEPTGSTLESQDSEKLVPVSEAIRYRKRAQTAEQQLGSVNERLRTLESELEEAQQTVGYLERRQKIDALLAESDAVDLDAARLLTEQAVMQMDEPDVKLAVTDLRRHKPYLFRHRSRSHGAMGARTEEPVHHAEAAAEQAMSSGDRRDLLAYLRLRRK